MRLLSTEMKVNTIEVESTVSIYKRAYVVLVATNYKGKLCYFTVINGTSKVMNNFLV